MKDIDESPIASSVLSSEMQFIQSRMVMIRNRPSLLMGDVACLYGVEPREIGQAVKNNPMKFPDGYVFDLTKEETDALKSKILILTQLLHRQVEAHCSPDQEGGREDMTAEENCG